MNGEIQKIFTYLDADRIYDCIFCHAYFSNLPILKNMSNNARYKYDRSFSTVQMGGLFFWQTEDF